MYTDRSSYITLRKDLRGASCTGSHSIAPTTTIRRSIARDLKIAEEHSLTYFLLHPCPGSAAAFVVAPISPPKVDIAASRAIPIAQATIRLAWLGYVRSTSTAPTIAATVLRGEHDVSAGGAIPVARPASARARSIRARITIWHVRVRESALGAARTLAIHKVETDCVHLDCMGEAARVSTVALAVLKLQAD